jgi:hypothetical protein
MCGQGRIQAVSTCHPEPKARDLACEREVAPRRGPDPLLRSELALSEAEGMTCRAAGWQRQAQLADGFGLRLQTIGKLRRLRLPLLPDRLLVCAAHRAG